MMARLPEALREHQFRKGHRPWNKGKHYSLKRREHEGGRHKSSRRRRRRRR
jgi:hypothetical protein